PEDLLFKSAFIEANLRALQDVTRATGGLTAVVGFVDKRDDIFNAAAILHDGRVAGVYHKQYLPNYGVFDEDRYFQAGSAAPVFTVGETCFAVNVCEDIWYPTGPTTRQALAGAELVVSINASPYHAGKGQQRERLIATRAADDLVCVAFVNTVGGQDELVFDGGSLIVNERGEIVARGRQFAEDFVAADLDLGAVLLQRHPRRCRAAGPEPRHRLPDAAHHAHVRVVQEVAGVGVQGLPGRRGRGEHPGAHPGHPADGAQQQVRLAGPDHRQQERDRRRLLHALRRHG